MIQKLWQTHLSLISNLKRQNFFHWATVWVFTVTVFLFWFIYFTCLSQSWLVFLGWGPLVPALMLWTPLQRGCPCWPPSCGWRTEGSSSQVTGGPRRCESGRGPCGSQGGSEHSRNGKPRGWQWERKGSSESQPALSKNKNGSAIWAEARIDAKKERDSSAVLNWNSAIRKSRKKWI